MMKSKTKKNTLYARYADLLVRYCLDLHEGDKLLIVSTYLSEPLLQEVFSAALAAGAYPETWLSAAGLVRRLYDEGSPAQLAHPSPLYAYAVEHYQAFLFIRAPFHTREMQSVDPDRLRAVAVGETKVKKRFRERSVAGELAWTLCEFPTDAQAQECGMSRREYEAFISRACFLNRPDPAAAWQEVRERQQRAVDRLNGARSVTFRGRDTDITFSTEGRKWINSDGRHNMPSGEVFTSPVENSVEGRVRFSYPAIYMGQEVEDVRLEVEGGRVVRWEAARGAGLLGKVLEVPGADRFGEAAIGTNAGINRFTRNILFDEKMGGTIHMALGSSYGEAGGKNECAVHWDMLADMRKGGEILADGEIIYRNGKFIF